MLPYNLITFNIIYIMAINQHHFLTVHHCLNLGNSAPFLLFSRLWIFSSIARQLACTFKRLSTASATVSTILFPTAPIILSLFLSLTCSPFSCSDKLNKRGNDCAFSDYNLPASHDSVVIVVVVVVAVGVAVVTFVVLRWKCVKRFMPNNNSNLN